MLKLFYAPGSLFSRKVRIVLAEKALEYESEVMSVSRAPADIFSNANPNLLIPVLIDGEMSLFESNLIIEYLLSNYADNALDSPQPSLAKSFTRAERHWEDAKTLATVESIADIVVNVRFYKSAGANVESNAYGRRQIVRFNYSLDWLEQRATSDGFIPGVFSIQDIGLICSLDYIDARNEILQGTLEWRGRPNLEAIVNKSRNRPSVLSTMPGPATNPNYVVAE